MNVYKKFQRISFYHRTHLKEMRRIGNRNYERIKEISKMNLTEMEWKSRNGKEWNGTIITYLQSRSNRTNANSNIGP